MNTNNIIQKNNTSKLMSILSSINDEIDRLDTHGLLTEDIPEYLEKLGQLKNVSAKLNYAESILHYLKQLNIN